MMRLPVGAPGPAAGKSASSRIVPRGSVGGAAKMRFPTDVGSGPGQLLVEVGNLSLAVDRNRSVLRTRDGQQVRVPR